MSNKNIILITGKPSAGKSSSLRNIEEKEKCAYFNTDLKELPIRDAMRFQTVDVTDPMDFIDGVQQVEEHPEMTMGVLDTLTFLMDMYESQYVLKSSNTQKAWGDYGQFYKSLIHAIKSGTKDYVIFAHEKDMLNESEMVMETKVPIKGAIGARGVNTLALLH